MKKEKLAVLFGGRSSEHEISVITALQAIQAIDSSIYQIVPVYIDMSGLWYTGDALLEKSFYQNFSENISKIQRISLLPDPSIGGFVFCNGEIINLNNKIPIDLCFLAFHGQYGEDGSVQGLLELADLPYTGCGVMGSALTMNKYASKMFLHAHGIPVLPSYVVTKEESKSNLDKTCRAILTNLKEFPLFVKPCNLGSSIGITAAKDLKGLQAGLANVFLYDEKALIEPYIDNLLEINVAVLGEDPPIASVVEIPLSVKGNTLTFEDKYLQGGNKTSEFGGMATLSRIIDPTDLDLSIKQQVIALALSAFTLLGSSGVSRFDFMYNKSNGQLYFNEVNTIPGSLAYYLWEKSHPPLLYTEVIHKMLQQAKKRKSQQLSLKRNMGFRALLKE